MATSLTSSLANQVAELVADLGVAADALQGGTLIARSPITGEMIGQVREHDIAGARQAIDAAQRAFLIWRTIPAPKRGDLIRLLGNELRAHKEALGRLVSIEVGKILSEGLGETQEMIDICDFAVGQSRQLYGLTIISRPRPRARMAHVMPFAMAERERGSSAFCRRRPLVCARPLIAPVLLVT